MKNKIITAITTTALCAAILSAQTFAADITEDTSIYAPDANEIAARVNKAIASYDPNIKVNSNTIMPLYEASLYDYVKNSKLEFTPSLMDGERAYFADYVDSGGNYAGSTVLVADGSDPGLYIQAPKELNPHLSEVDFRANADRIGRCLKEHGLSTNIIEAKTAWIEGLGHVYYIKTDNGEAFAAMNFKGVSGYYFNVENEGFVVMNDELKAKVLQQLDEIEAYKATVGDRPLTGNGSSPAFVLGDEENPDTGASCIPFTSVALITGLCASGFTVIKKKKN